MDKYCPVMFLPRFLALYRYNRRTFTSLQSLFSRLVLFHTL